MAIEKNKNWILRISKRLFIFFTIIGAVLLTLWLWSTKVTHNLDTYIYNLPYKEGTSHKVVQGYGGLFSHNGLAALDFYMPVGTEIYAAREGVIYAYKEDGQKGGALPKYKNYANYIIIKHDDGSFGCYWHLQYKGVVTKNGRVQKGQLIGYSGDTGFVLGPHLHFTVKNKLNYDKDSFVRTKFYTTQGILLLKRGKSYERPL
jgi:murein DD-endopeptidase MepM/ murein hydrolase activator NlpD